MEILRVLDFASFIFITVEVAAAVVICTGVVAIVGILKAWKFINKCAEEVNRND